MSEEKPLHVQVAEALGWTNPKRIGGVMGWQADGPKAALSCPVGPVMVPRYDLDWAVTGPLMQKVGAAVFCFRSWSSNTFVFRGKEERDGWQVEVDAAHEGFTWGGNGETPLLAFCRMLITMEEKRPGLVKELLA